MLAGDGGCPSLSGIGGFPSKSGKSRLRRDDEALRLLEATNALLPGKASKHQVTSVVLGDTGGQVEYQGACENSGEGTRQNGAMCFGRKHADM